MAVSVDTSVESHTGTAGSASEASFSWSHTIAAGARGLLVFVFNLDNNTGDVVSVDTQGGVNIPAVSGAVATDTAGELGRASAFFIGSGVPTGAQTIVVTRNNNANVMYAVSVSILATSTMDTAVHTAGIVLVQEDGTVAVQSVTDGSPGTNSMRFAGGYFGHQTLPTAGTGSTLLQSIDVGASGAVVVRETTAGQGARNVGMSSGTSDDRAIVHFAIKEVTAVITVNGGVANEDDSVPAGSVQQAAGAVGENIGFRISRAKGNRHAYIARRGNRGLKIARSGFVPASAPIIVSGGVANENDAVPTGTPSNPATIAGGVATEDDAAPVGSIQQPQAPIAGGIATEDNAVPAGTAVNPATVAGGVATEDDAVPAGATSNPTTIAGGVASEDDAVPAGSTSNQTTVSGGVATEDDAVPAGTPWVGYPAVVMQDSPVGYWRMADATDQTDSSGHGFTLTQQGTPSDTTSLVATQSSNGAKNFASDTADGFTHADDPLLRLTTAFSVEAWVTVGFVGAAFRAAQKDSHYRLGVNSSGNFRFSGFTASAFVDLDSTTVAVQDAVYHIVGTYDGTNVRLYVNGVLDSTPTALSGAMPVTASNFAIGADPGVGTGWFGKIDDVAIYPTALSATRVQAHYDAGHGPDAPITVSGGVANEDDAVPAGTASNPATIAGGIATEDDAAPAGAPNVPQVVSGGVATEDDAAPAGTVIAPQVIAGGVANEDNAVPAGTPVGVADAVSFSAPVFVSGARRSRLIMRFGRRPPALVNFGAIVQTSAQTAFGGVATEGDAVPSGTIIQPQVVQGGVANENDTTPAGTPSNPATIAGGVANENDAALSGTAVNPATIAGGVANENNAVPAGATSNPTTIQGGTANENDTAPAGTVVAPIIVVGGVAMEANAVPGGSTPTFHLPDTRQPTGAVVVQRTTTYSSATQRATMAVQLSRTVTDAIAHRETEATLAERETDTAVVARTDTQATVVPRRTTYAGASRSTSATPTRTSTTVTVEP